MIKIKGEYTEAIVYTNTLEEAAREQIKQLCDMEYVKESQIRIMPDVHAGAGCTIGTTMTITDKIVPNLVGVDIGCGMETVQIGEADLNLKQLDKVIKERIPSGRNIRDTIHQYMEEINLNELRCKNSVNINRAVKSIGTLGGGNHFIEVDQDEAGRLYIVIHSGSRYLGKEVATLYQKMGYERLNQRDARTIPYELAYVEDDLYEDYLHDMELVQRFAKWNRKAMMEEIITSMNLTVTEQFTTIHNYIDTEAMILRKGAVSAKKGEKLLIPMNMRDGSLICMGKGNEEWNVSAPHGAGRLISRKKAKDTFSMTEFKQEMKDVYTTSVSQATIDECPMAYKSMEEIISQITPTADILKIIKPIYNYKAGE